MSNSKKLIINTDDIAWQLDTYGDFAYEEKCLAQCSHAAGVAIENVALF